MKRRFSCIFLTALFVIALSQLLTTSAQQATDSPKTPKAEPAKAKTDDTPIPIKASADDKTAVAKTDRAKLQRPDDGKIILPANAVSVTVSVTDSYQRFVTGLNKDHFEV